MSGRYARIAPYFSAARNIYKCPADRYASPAQRAIGWTQRVRSVSMNFFVGEGAWEGSKDWWADRRRVYKKLGDFRQKSPSQIWVFDEAQQFVIGNPRRGDGVLTRRRRCGTGLNLASPEGVCRKSSSLRFGPGTLGRSQSKHMKTISLLSAWVLAAVVTLLAVRAESAPASEVNLWDLAKRPNQVHRFSTLFTAQDVRGRLSSEAGIDQAIDWCKRTAVTKVYVEEFRDGYQAERAALLHAKERFQAAGIETAGCITPTRVGKPSTGWKGEISCYTDKPTQEKLKAIFEYAAGLFDEIMIDDFWFTDCACPECEAARKAKTVSIGDRTCLVSGDTWEDYRGELMVQLSRDYVLAAARKVNPRVRLIIKYPQWYDRFHERGYDVVRETADFDRIWVGTETRDYRDTRWGGTVPYEAYFIMRWLGGIGGRKCGGGWYDWLGTTERTYIEQARQTVLAGARESMLFCYGGLLGTTGPRNVEALRASIPELLTVAKEIRRRPVIGIAAYKPPNSHPGTEARVFDFVGMLGLPLVPCHEFPAKAPAAFFSVHALKDADLAAKLAAFIKSGKPVLLTDGLAQRLAGKVALEARNVRRLPVKDDPKSLLQLGQTELDELRQPLLSPLKTSFRAPNQVALYLFKDGSWVVENFNDQPVAVELNGKKTTVAERGWSYRWR